MTERLYYDDAYCTRFTARITGVSPHENGYAVTLDRSAFYPTSGGQPYDTGTIAGARVLDVYPESTGEVVHIVDRALAIGDIVECEIDWPRRFEHMQQHAADHMIAGALYRKCGAHTIGLHIGSDISTIDVELPGQEMRLTDAEIREIEDTVNREIQENLPIRCFFPTAEELPTVPFRKAPTVQTHIRAVMIGSVECVACGGTHPRATGEIGLIKILDTRPSRGKMRLTFLAGMRALNDYQSVTYAARQAAAALSCKTEQLPDRIEQKMESLREAQTALVKAKCDLALQQAQARYRLATPILGMRAVEMVLPGLDMAGLRDVAAMLTQAPDAVALFANAEDDAAQIVFARGADVSASMGALLARVTKALGGKGGGKPEFAQGAAPGLAALALAKDVLTEG